MKIEQMVYTYYDGPRRIMKARELRRLQTKAEAVLWQHVRNRQLGGFKIRRQQIIEEFIVDFFCAEKGLCIEIDGPYHFAPDKRDSDKLRDEKLAESGVSVLRFTNDQVLYELDQVLADILVSLEHLPSSCKAPLKHGRWGDFSFWPEADSPLP